MQLAFDHAVVTVPALPDAVAAFRDAGFTVLPGGRHDVLPTENALVVFADGGYLELLALRDDDARDSVRALRASPKWEAHLRGASVISRRFLPRLAGPAGVGDFVLRGARLARFAAESRKRGFVMTGPVAMSRRRPDGEELAWELVLPVADELPFFIEDRTPLALRVPGGAAATAHANGAAGVAAVRVRCDAVAGTALAYAELFDAAPRVNAAGETELALAGLGVTLAEGGPAGACALTLRGVASLPAAIEALGVHAGG